MIFLDIESAKMMLRPGMIVRVRSNDLGGNDRWLRVNDVPPVFSSSLDKPTVGFRNVTRLSRAGVPMKSPQKSHYYFYLSQIVGLEAP